MESGSFQTSIWVYLQGAVLQIPSTWRDMTEHTFTNPARVGEYLTWESQGDSTLDGEEWLAGRRERVVKAMPEASISPINEVVGATLPTFGFTVSFGDGGPMLALFTIDLGPTWLSLKAHVAYGRQEPLERLLRSVEEWPLGLAQPKGRYPVLGVSFYWEEELLLPRHFAFESPTRDSSLVARWTVPKDGPLNGPNWQQHFSLMEEAEILALLEETTDTVGGSTPAPFPPVAMPYFMQVRNSSVRAEARGPNELTFCQARTSETAGSHLELSFRNQGAMTEALATWRWILASVQPAWAQGPIG